MKWSEIRFFWALKRFLFYAGLKIEIESSLLILEEIDKTVSTQVNPWSVFFSTLSCLCLQMQINLEVSTLLDLSRQLKTKYFIPVLCLGLHPTFIKNIHKMVSNSFRDKELSGSSVLWICVGDPQLLESWLPLLALACLAKTPDSVPPALRTASSCWGLEVSVSLGTYPGKLLCGWREEWRGGLTHDPPPAAPPEPTTPPVRERARGLAADKLTLWVVVCDIMPP